ncbi:hypothetical protein POM88_013330 [Heracleum sosnowskyi]|uniref:CCHC-type domain-containing protein n=1 Tax=Heracleum sosnowskyi TaxID=360622 RepID=A0AAD8IZT0_9APIA|nr:hypothetical protein POM88_013330 [Heracleum sosnowskyi]
MAKSGEDLTTMFERFSKLMTELHIHGKYYDRKELNAKFLLTLPEHLEHKVTAIREGRNLNNISLETLYGVLKSYELEFFQKRAILAGSRGKMANMSDEDFYSLEEMEKMDNPTIAYMAKKFKNIRFKRNKPYKSQGQTSRFSKGNFSKGEGGATRGGYKTGMVDRSKFRCYNCNELGHFATKCRRPK